MTKITKHTSDILIVESKPRFAFAIIILLGLIATYGAFFGILNPNEGFSVNNIFGIILGPGFVLGGLFLYIETKTVFDKNSNLVTWRQYGLSVHKSDSTSLDQVQDVVAARPVSQQSGGGTCLVLVLSDRRWSLSFGFSGLNAQDKKIIETIKSFTKKPQTDGINKSQQN